MDNITSKLEWNLRTISYVRVYLRYVYVYARRRVLQMGARPKLNFLSNTCTIISYALDFNHFRDLKNFYPTHDYEFKCARGPSLSLQLYSLY